ncbi:hypothetical protein MIMGU_mgv11b015757mg [Erythranthe guttata]|uniref:Uncharacterized protein n=1 Tax=Erythranthe guttata TaxID=4155 RepID=A0A022QAB8_ERYGU|nr:hypothetical protein MIMGU_mgv11b015757mg [Erythranthe guttata]
MGDPLGSPRVAPPPHIFLSSARTDRAEKFWGGRSIENARISPINVPFAFETAREWAKRTIFTSTSRAYADCVVTPPESKVINV